MVGRKIFLHRVIRKVEQGVNPSNIVCLLKLIYPAFFLQVFAIKDMNINSRAAYSKKMSELCTF